MMTMRFPRHDERGQTLPMWTFAVLTALTLMFFSFNYANVVRWQVRAQNAADAAATAALSVQATQWNKMTSLLYASDVEEWRIRHLLDGMLDASAGNGGCAGPSVFNNGNRALGTCLAVYNALEQQYNKAVNRYTNEIEMLQAIAPIGETSQQADATNIVKQMALNCGKSFGGDCAFTYKLVNYGPRSANLQQVSSDAFFVGVGFTQSDPSNSTPVADFEPAQIEIATCATVHPLINFSFFGLAPTSFTVIGRAAATTVTVTEEWFEPGTFINPGPAPFSGTTVFQPLESYATDGVTAPSPRDWYDTNYPSATYSAFPTNNAYQANNVNEDFSVMASWWAAIPVAPYTGTQTQLTLCGT
jgi:hypothetical protein